MCGACITLASDAQDFGITWTNLTENSAGRVASFVDYDWGMPLKRDVGWCSGVGWLFGLPYVTQDKCPRCQTSGSWAVGYVSGGLLYACTESE